MGGVGLHLRSSVGPPHDAVKTSWRVDLPVHGIGQPIAGLSVGRFLMIPNTFLARLAKALFRPFSGFGVQLLYPEVGYADL